MFPNLLQIKQHYVFTGIIESMGEVVGLEKEGGNLHLRVRSDISDDLKIDQSVSHNGVCLTVVSMEPGTHTVTAIQETLDVTAIGELTVGSIVNLERAMLPSQRLDGHFVQGHVDQVARCQEIIESDGSWYFHFTFPDTAKEVLVDKGSICINGVSLTLVETSDSGFSVAIIPYTYEHTNFQQLVPGSRVNIEFDVIGKYVAKLFARYQKG